MKASTKSPQAKQRWKARLARVPAAYWAARWFIRTVRAARCVLFPGRSFWDRAVTEAEADHPRGWLDLELVEREYVRPRISGDRDVDYLRHFVHHHLEAPADIGLSLGCGGGHLERALLDLGAARRMEGLDASAGSIHLARRLAAEAGVDDRITYRLEDLDRVELPPARYDFVVAKMALHHFSRLEHVYDQVASALRPGGIFLANEYVGPDRFQWTDVQLRLANQWLEELPQDVRRAVPVPSIRRPTLREMMADDPTESVRSSEVLPLLRQRFDIVEEKPFGGTVLQLLLAAALPAFDLDDARHLDLLRQLCRREGELLDSGALPSDFVHVVAKKRPEAGQRLTQPSAGPNGDGHSPDSTSSRP